MYESLDRLYESIQLLKGAGRVHSKGRWHVRPRDSEHWDGPYGLAELAFRIYNGEVASDAHVVDRRTGRGHVVSQHAFFAHWLTHSPGKDRELFQGLKGEIDTQAELPKRSLTRKQREAFGLLSLHHDCTYEEARKRHRALVFRNHPDRGGSLEQMLKINWAYSVVSEATAC